MTFPFSSVPGSWTGIGAVADDGAHFFFFVSACSIRG